jgi:hypothetical protein
MRRAGESRLARLPCPHRRHRRVRSSHPRAGPRGSWILGPIGYALARAGRQEEAAAIAREIESADDGGVQLTHVYAGLGTKPRALDALDRAYAQRIVDLSFRTVDPLPASLRVEPRFLTLKSRMGL